MEKEITTGEQAQAKTLERDAEATENADGARIKKRAPRKTIEELREESRSYTHEFAKSFTYGGSTVEKLTFDWDTLTGRDSIAIDRELTKSSGGQGVQNFGREHMALIAVRACSARNENDIRIVSKEFMEALPIVDFEEITAMGRLFFRFWGLT